MADTPAPKRFVCPSCRTRSAVEKGALCADCEATSDALITGQPIPPSVTADAELAPADRFGFLRRRADFLAAMAYLLALLGALGVLVSVVEAVRADDHIAATVIFLAGLLGIGLYVVGLLVLSGMASVLIAIEENTRPARSPN